jgi:hypothetical protein
MLWLVTMGAPTTGEAFQEEITIRIFLTGFPQKELPASLGRNVEKGV